MATQQNLTIESYRGLAILLVVIGHTIGSTPDGGMKIDYPSIFRDLYLPIDYIQMTLFTLISGFVYDLHPFLSTNRASSFIQKKIVRLLIPMICVSTLFYVIQSIIPGTNQQHSLLDLWHIYIFPYSIYWYLPALFWMFILTVVLEKFHFLDQLKTYSATLLLSIVGMGLITYQIIPDSFPNYFSFKGTLVYYASFLGGIGIHRYKRQSIAIYGIGIFLTSLGIFIMHQEYLAQQESVGTLYFLKRVAALGTCYLFLKLNFNNRFFIFIGKYAYSIYLFHVFGTAGAKILLRIAKIDQPIFIFIGGVITAMIFPIVLEQIIARSNVLRLMLLGQKGPIKTRYQLTANN